MPSARGCSRSELRIAQRGPRNFASRVLPPGPVQHGPQRPSCKPGPRPELQCEQMAGRVMYRSCVILADAHPNMLEAVRGLLEGRFTVTVMVADDRSLLEAATRMQPDLVVVDLSLPASGGVNVLRTLLGRHPGLRIIVLSVHDEPPALSHALGAGASGFVLKRTAGIDLTAAVDAVLRGETYVSPSLGWRPQLEGQE